MTKPVKIAVLADTRDAVKGFAAADRAAQDAGRGFDKAGDAAKRSTAGFDAAADAAGNTASTASQTAGGLGDLGGALALMPGPLGAVGAGMEAVGPAIMGVTGAADLAEVAFGKLKIGTLAQTVATNAATVATRALSLAQKAMPILAIVGLVTLLVGAIVLAWKRSETFRNVVTGAFDAVKTAASALWSGIKWALDKVKDLFLNFTGPGLLIKHFDKVKDAGSAAFEGIKNVASSVFNAIASLWNNTIGKLSFKVPGWVPGLGGKGFDVPDIPMLAQGGIVNRPTLALIGEAGPEAVVPLNRFRGEAREIRIHLTADTLDQLARGRSIRADLDAWDNLSA